MHIVCRSAACSSIGERTRREKNVKNLFPIYEAKKDAEMEGAENWKTFYIFICIYCLRPTESS